jgi:hypothetical protein
MFSLATSQPPREWVQPIEVLTCFTVLELFTAYVVEPFLFGLSVGVSPVALLMAAIFWTWLWGPLGLLLSTPLTVCLLVLGRYVPQLSFFEVILGNSPSLDISVLFYQRLLAKDQHEAANLIKEQLRSCPREKVFDDVIIPALVLAKSDRENGELTENDEQYILQAAGNIIADLSPLDPADRESSLRCRVTIFGLPASDKFDELALKILQQMLVAEGGCVQIVSTIMLASEMTTVIEKARPALAVIATLPPGGIAQTRYYCKRVRAKFPDLKILVGRWGPEESSVNKRERILAAGANQLGTSLAETASQLITFLQVEAATEGTKEFVPSS